MKLHYPITLIFLITIFSHTLMAMESNLIQNIVLSGNESFSDEQIHAKMKTEIGANYDEEVLKQDFERIIEFYRKHGFQFARIDEMRQLIKEFADGVFLHIYIDEGTIGEISVEGNTRTKDYVIIRELLFQVGDTYTVEDELESERILRRKSYLGTAEIEATWDVETMSVTIHVQVSDLWSFIPALDLPAFGQGSSNFLMQIADSNLFGSGNRLRFRYQLINEDGEKTRSLVQSRYTVPRLSDSYWEFDGQYTQKREGDSWEVRLRRPQYSLKTRWSADLSISESFDEIRWYEHGKKTDTFDRSRQSHSGQITRYFGDRHRQTQLSFWTLSRRSKFTQIEKLAPSDADFQDRNIKMVGISIGRRNVDFVRTRFLNQMGRVEDVGIGYGYSVSLGRASPLFGSDRSDTSVSLRFFLSEAHEDLFFLNAQTGLTTRFADKDSIFNTSVKLTRKDLWHQTLAAQVSTMMQFGLKGESQIILGGLNGLRGYDSRQFSGENMLLFNIESRTIFRGGAFRKLENWIVLGSAVFADVGYVWNGEEFDLREPRRSVGFGLRVSIPKLSGSRIYRFDLAFPLDNPEESSRNPVFTYGVGHVF